MKTYKINRVLNLFFLLILFGCSVFSSTEVKTTPTVIPMKIPTPTFVINIPVTTLRPPVTEESFELVVDNCVKTEQYDTPPPVETANHFLLFQEDVQPRSLYLLNVGNGIETPIPSTNPYSVFVSPNHAQFGYVQFKDQSGTESITINDNKGKVVKLLPLPLASFFWGWLDNDQVMITTKKDVDSKEPYTLLVLNLLTDTGKELVDQMTYKDFDNTTYLRWQYNRVIYDSTLNFAVYPSHYGEAITLYNVSLRKELSVLQTAVALIASPAWSPDGNFVVVAGAPEQMGEETVLNRDANELFLLDKLENVTLLTHFSKQYGEGEVGNMSWSPNGKYIAMWVRVGSDKNERLMLLNLDSRQITDYCITGMEFDEGYPMQPNPIWSPDSRIVLINHRDSAKGTIDVIWIDIQNDIAGMYPANAYLWGWLTTP